MEKKVREFLKSHDLYPERGIHNESGTLIGLGDLLNNFAKSLPPSTDSSEVSESDVEKKADEFFNTLQKKHFLNSFNIVSNERYVKQLFYDFANQMRSKLKSQWVSVEDRLPELNKEYSVHVWCWDGESVFDDWFGVLGFSQPTTHWQYIVIPESPIK